MTKAVTRMTVVIERLKLAMLGLFAVLCVGLWAYNWIVVAPRQHCEAMGNWWDVEGRTCAVPIDLRRFPRLTPPPSAQPAANKAPAAPAAAPGP